MSFFEELKRRNVFRVGIAYVVGAWLVLQFTEVITELLSLPATVGPVVVAIVAVGLPVVLFAAWAYELTPQGIKRESEVEADTSITRNTGRKLNGLIIALLSLAVVVLLAERFLSDDPSETDEPAVASTPAPIEAPPPTSPTSGDMRPAIAVLPFDNRSNLEADQFFTDGIHDDLLTTLAKIGSLKVISRTSVNEYRDTTKKIPEIAAELGVDHVLEGGIQRAGDVVRVNVQLIDAATDEHLWAELYERELTASNLFAIQSEITRAVADALAATLSPQDLEQLDRLPTENLAAYDAYLRGRQMMPERTSTALDDARTEFQLATQLDPDFALAWVGIAETNLLLSAYGAQQWEVSLTRAEQAVQKALALDPRLGEAWTAMGTVLEGKERFDEAEAAYKRGVELAPNYATAWHWYFDFLMDWPARLDDAVVASEKARELDPRSSIIRNDAAHLYVERGEFEEARDQYLALIDMDPTFAPAYGALSELLGGEMGQFPEAYGWALQALDRDSGNADFWGTLVFPLMIVGAWDTVERTLTQAEDEVASPQMFDWIRAYSAVYQGRPQAALELLGAVEPNEDFPGRNWGAGTIYVHAGEIQKARDTMFVGASDFSDRGNWETLLARWKSDACLAGWVFLEAGEEQFGRQLLERSIDYLENELPRYIDVPERYSTAACHAALGNDERALDALESLLDSQQYWGWHYVTYWPPVQQLGQHERMAELQARFDEEMARQRVEVLRLHEERFGVGS